MLRAQNFIFTLILLAFFASVSEAKTESGFLNRSLKMGATTYAYQVYVPANWTPKQKWPVVLFLHGAGERGSDGLIQTEVGIGTAVRRHAERAQCVIVFPQCLAHHWWTEAEMQTQALKALELAVKEFNGDPQRLYLTGISMGGYGTWAMAAAQPGKFAALAPVCGGVRVPQRLAEQFKLSATQSDDPYTPMAQKIGKTPVWIFHGSADTTVPTTESRQMNEALKATGGNVKYTEYEGVGHNSWEKAYAEAEFFNWLLAQKLDAKAKLNP
ncbi:MAG: prolyl oligopeptidase family serine peptidase [Acidobacteria bacterium]|nr:prolyl oligopeptidase family serine peptidase [Acidobacteriota bacterium]